MKKAIITLSLVLMTLAGSSLAIAKEHKKFRLFKGDYNCGEGYRLATYREALDYHRKSCDKLGDTASARLAHNGSAKGYGFYCKYRRRDTKPVQYSLCVMKNHHHPSSPVTPSQKPNGQHISQHHYYRLSTQFRGDNRCLDIYNGGEYNNMTHLTRCRELSGQFWRLRHSDQDGYYKLSTLFRGKNMCLDIHNGGPLNNQPHLTRCANFSGQYWKVKGPDVNGYYHLTTQFRGKEMCLDIHNGGRYNDMPHLTPCANVTGQFWKLHKTNQRVNR